MKRPSIALGLLSFAALLAACQRQSPLDPTSAGMAVGPAAVLPPVDLGALQRRVHFAFREEGGGFRAGHATHAILAQRDGSVKVTPYQPAEGGKAAVAGAPLTLRTVEISRQSERLGPPPRLRVGADGALRLERSGSVEQLSNTARGLHQEWRFDAAPAGRGDLVVRIAASGAGFREETAGGLHFRQASPGAGLRYGNATWIDAAGRRTPVSARWSSGEIVLRVPAAVVEGSAYPAVLDPYVSPEIFSDSPVPVGVPGPQTAPKVSSTSSQYLVVWQDQTNVYGARISNELGLLDPFGFVICQWASWRAQPAVAADDTGYFVVWRDDRGLGYTGADLWGTRVSTTGSVLSPGGVPLVQASGDQTAPSIAFDNSLPAASNPAFLVVFEDNSNISALHLEQDGGTREASKFLVSADAGASSPSVSFDGTTFVAAWSSSGDIYSVPISRTSAALGTELALATSAAPEGSPSVAGGTNDQSLVVWEVASDIWGAILTGGSISAGPFEVCDAGSASKPTAAWDGTRFEVAWSDTRDGGIIMGTAISTSGVPSTVVGNVLSTSGANPSIATNVADPLMVYEDNASLGAPDIYGRQVLGSFSSSGSPQWITSLGNAQSKPAVASDGTTYLAVWEDNRNASNSTDLYGVRISRDGEVLDPGGIAISTAPGVQRRPAIAAGPGQFLVAWEDFRQGKVRSECGSCGCGSYATSDIYATLVLDDGSVGPAAGFAVADAEGIAGGPASKLSPAATFDGTNYFIAWSDDRDSPGQAVLCSSRGGSYDGAPAPTDLYALRISPSGEPVDQRNGFLLASDPGQILDVKIATIGEEHAVGWSNGDLRFSCEIGCWYPHVEGGHVMVVEPDGTVVHAPELVVRGGPYLGLAFQLAATRNKFWTVWHDHSSPDAKPGLRMISVELDGWLGPLQHPVDPPRAEHHAALAYDGDHMVLTFTAQYDGSASPGLYVTWLDDDGQVLTPEPLPVTVGPSTGGHAAIAGDGAGQALVVYEKLDPDLAASRVRSNIVEYNEPGTPGGSCGGCSAGLTQLALPLALLVLRRRRRKPGHGAAHHHRCLRTSRS